MTDEEIRRLHKLLRGAFIAIILASVATIILATSYLRQRSEMHRLRERMEKLENSINETEQSGLIQY